MGGGGIIILVSCEYHFFRVHQALVQDPNNKISIMQKRYLNRRFSSRQIYLQHYTSGFNDFVLNCMRSSFYMCMCLGVCVCGCGCESVFKVK